MEIHTQVLTFVITIVTGIVLGGVFDGYRVLRRKFSPKTFVTWFADLLYWFLATAIMFITLVFSNWGELRFYVFLGVMSGLVMYYRLLSVYAIRFFLGGVECIIKLLNLLDNIITTFFIKPTLFLIKILIFPFIFTVNKCAYWFKTYCSKPPDEKL